MDVTAWSTINVAQMFLRLFLSMIFFLSAIDKIQRPQQFIETISLYNLLPKTWSKSIAFAIISLELVLAILLLAGWQSRIVAEICLLLVIVFSCAVGINLIRGRTHIGCGCFGSNHSAKINLRLIGRNLILIVAAIYAMLWGGGALALDSYPLVLERLLTAETLLPFILICLGGFLLFLLIRRLYGLLLLMPAED
ncbi:MAG: DoxX family membrane protein [Chloroflexota bacterium]|nr:DoxX family membrane protein [Chloroflexota bacterium]